MAHVAYKWRLMSSCQIELSGQAGGPCPIPFEPLFCGTRTHTHTERRTDRMFVLRSNCSYSNWNSTILWLRFDLITTWQRVRAVPTAAEAMGRGRCNCSSSSSMQRQPPPNIQYIYKQILYSWLYSIASSGGFPTQLVKELPSYCFGCNLPSWQPHPASSWILGLTSCVRLYYF